MIKVEVNTVIRKALAVFIVAGFLTVGVTAAPKNAIARLVGQPAPEIGNDTWIHTEPLRLKDLKGKVVLLEFWTYG